jgi:hypothetical protein
LETIPDETRDAARVIDMSMGEDHAINFTAWEKFMTIAFEGFFSLALEQAAVKQDLLTIHFDEVLRAGDRAGGAVESNFHCFSCAG